MILQALMQLAEQEHLLDNPDYELKRISWRAIIHTDGSLINLVSYRQDKNEGTNKKPKYVGKWSSVPRQPIRTSGDKSFFLVDKAEYVFGLDPQGKQKETKLNARSSLFLNEVKSCAAATNDGDVRAVLTFLTKVAETPAIIFSLPQFEEILPNDLIGFAVGAEWVHQNESVQEYFGRLREVPAHSEGKRHATFQCLVTGKHLAEIPLFPLLKKVPGGTSSGVALVSHNSNAFYSYGLKGNDNAPISREAAEASACALTRLLDDDYRSPSDPDVALSKRHVRLGANTIVCFWARDKNEESDLVLDALPNLLNGEDDETVGTVYQSIWNGRPVELKNPNDFYALTLSGTQGRVIVRDWLDTSLAEVVTNLAKHFADLKICRNTHPKKGQRASPAVPMYWLLNSLAAEGRSESVPPVIEASFIRSAIRGTPYPFQLLQRALVRSRAEAGRDEWSDSMRRDSRAAILRAVLNRKRIIDPKANTRYPKVDVEMNPNLDSPGYSCGMLIAILERLQALAIGDVNASLIDRFFSAASASPRSVFVRLLKNSQHHYRKVRDDADTAKRGNARYMERLKDEVISRFTTGEVEPIRKVYPPKASGFPMHLNLEQQGLFVLGYHQMRHWLWMNKEQRAAWELRYPNAPMVFKRKKQEETEVEEETAAATS